ncbi:MAG: homoserine O-succinyltransferase [Bacteroidales bacterium]|nr:homoserine O-succinyltransferase [Bacteroidales bacterium]
MPLTIPANLPAVDLLKKENIFVMDSQRASSQDIRPLKLVILNLMPLKITTETDLIRLLSNSPLQIEIDFMKIAGHISKNTPIEHMEAFYKEFSLIKEDTYDGMIVTGAPVEQLNFCDVSYWEELTTIFKWARTHVTSTMYICWAAQAALNYFYDIPKYSLSQKRFGVFLHSIYNKQNPIFRGFDDEFYAPHSRHSEIRREDVEKVPEIEILSESKEAGLHMLMARGGREIFITGHSEYSPNTLKDEYFRDKNKGLEIQIPLNYFPNDDTTKEPQVKWRAHANLLFSNWLNYFVYQETPYDIKSIK